MDFHDDNIEGPGGFNAGGGKSWENPTKVLPADLPKSLDDRRHMPAELVPETEMYDGWQGVFLTFYKVADAPDFRLTCRARTITVSDITDPYEAPVFWRPQLT
jgi:hypothetical protein